MQVFAPLNVHEFAAMAQKVLGDEVKVEVEDVAGGFFVCKMWRDRRIVVAGPWTHREREWPSDEGMEPTLEVYDSEEKFLDCDGESAFEPLPYESSWLDWFMAADKALREVGS